MNIQQLQTNLQRVEGELAAVRTAFIATRSLLLAALEQLQQNGQFNPGTLALPEEARKNKKLAEWLEQVTASQPPAN